MNTKIAKRSRKFIFKDQSFRNMEYTTLNSGQKIAIGLHQVYHKFKKGLVKLDIRRMGAK